MTQEQQEALNVSIAKVCGWWVSDQGWWSHPTLEDNGGAMPYPPNYFRDLNAMHEAEKVLTPEQWKDYSEDMCQQSHSGYLTDHLLHATAKQKAESFLRALNLWKED